MSKGDEIYVRRSGSSDLVVLSETEDHMWDDSSMTAAYDKAVNKANAEIAKQIAMETNSKFKGDAKPNDKKGKTPMKSTKSKVWKVGMPCRTIYLEDGVEYEAVISTILENGECVVRFVGFNNFEIVHIASLKESRGEETRRCQIELATGDKFDDGFESLSNEDVSFEASAAGIQQKGKKSKKKSPKNSFPDFPKMSNIPSMPDMFRLNSAFTGPAISDFRLPNIPFPPPPPPAALQISDPEEQALSSMLISWYMSGYHTGLYQGLKRSKENRRH